MLEHHGKRGMERDASDANRVGHDQLNPWSNSESNCRQTVKVGGLERLGGVLGGVPTHTEGMESIFHQQVCRSEQLPDKEIQ